MLKEIDEPSGNIPKSPGVTVFVSNLSEDVWPFISNISGAKEKKAEIAENAYLADRDLFSLAEEDRIVWITPKPISDKFLAYFTSLFGTKKAEILVPQNHSGEISKDIMKDKKIVERLIELANSVKKLTLIPYTTSFQFLELENFLKKQGISVYTPESPQEEDAWTVNFYGSKSGIRQLSQESSAIEPDFVMSDGFISVGISDAAKIAAKKYIREGGVVIKTNKGHSGMGVLILRPGDLPNNYKACAKEILNKLKKDSYWDKFPIIIESFININPTIAGGCPNVEFKIFKNGRVEFLYFCGMRVTREGVFKGMEVNDDVISDRLETQMMDTGFFVGERYSQMGYRGYYDVDFVISRGGKLYVTESNVRRTGGTHVFHIASKLIGDDFLYDTYILSNNLYPLPEGKEYDFEKIHKILTPILYNKKTKEGIVIISENLLELGKLTYVIFGNTKKRAFKIESQMETLLNS